MPVVLVLGAGVMGSAFCVPVADAGTTVRLVGTHLDTALIDGIRADRVHPRLKAPLPAGVEPFQHHELRQALRDDVELIVLGVSPAGIGWAIEQLKPLLPGPRPVLLLTKGLDADGRTLRPLTDRVGPALGCPAGGIGGPCIAGELAVRRDTCSVVAHPDPAVLRRTLALARAPYYHLRPSHDVAGVETCAALKNFYALGVGAAAGMLDRDGEAANGARMNNIAAGLFAQSLLELGIVNRALGGRPETVHGLAGTGDLYVTVQAGRNSRMGRLLGQGWTYSRAKAERMAEDTVEGAELALACGPTLEHLLRTGRIAASLPLTGAIVDSVCRDAALTLDWSAFHDGPPSA